MTVVTSVVGWPRHRDCASKLTFVACTEISGVAAHSGCDGGEESSRDWDHGGFTGNCCHAAIVCVKVYRWVIRVLGRWKGSHGSCDNFEDYTVHCSWRMLP